MNNYKELETKFREIGVLDSATAVLHWDAAVMMPEGSSPIRGEQLALLQQISHQKLTDESLSDKVDAALADTSKLNDWQKANLREMKRKIDHSKAVPEDLLTAKTLACNKCEMTWRTARAANDFKSLKPALEEVVNLTRQEAKAKSEYFNLSPYDALLDSYEVGSREKDIDKAFSQLKEFLPGFTQEVVESQGGKIDLLGSYPIEKQKELGLEYMESLGFDFSKGRLDVSLHPFCGGNSDDVRLTTRYYEDTFVPSFLGVMHETGHALYNSNLPKEWRYQPVGSSLGTTIHESQSLFVEKQITKSKEFIEHLLPKVHSAFGVDPTVWTLDKVHKHITYVEPSYIRVDADEVTYPSHVMLRYDLEKAFLSGDLQVEDLPTAWSEKMQEYLGVTPDSDANGCMQDVHWNWGAFGYFPTYTLGAMAAAQFMATLKKEMPDVNDKMRIGDFKTIIAWLNKNIHSHGAFYNAEELLNKITGEDLNSLYFIEHLKSRYKR